MIDQCERPPTNAEVALKIVKEFFKFFSKPPLRATFFSITFCSGMFFYLSKLSISDCIEGARWLISLV
jgi:hypothetical protein